MFFFKQMNQKNLWLRNELANDENGIFTVHWSLRPNSYDRHILAGT